MVVGDLRGKRDAHLVVEPSAATRGWKMSHLRLRPPRHARSLPGMRDSCWRGDTAKGARGCMTAMPQLLLALGALVALCAVGYAADVDVKEDDTGIKVSTRELEFVIRKKASKGLTTYAVSGVSATSFLDKKTGFRDPGFGLDIVDWVMESGSDEAYRDQLEPELVYQFNNSYHGKIPKRCIEGPQMCVRVPVVEPRVIRGKDFVAIATDHRYTTAAPGKKAGSLWQQRLVFPAGQRYFISADKVT